MNDISRKRKRPSFQHLPQQQAVKAKQAWVNKVKLRSKWSKERRKWSGKGREEDEVEDEEPRPIEKRNRDKGPTIEDEEQMHPSRRKARPLPPTPTISKEEEKLARERVRELTKQAYSKEALHTFKADPLGRRRGDVKGRKKGKGGQPNMKLRMNALLEKIKLDVDK